MRSTHYLASSLPFKYAAETVPPGSATFGYSQISSWALDNYFA